MKFLDLTGQKFNRWTVKRFAYIKNHKAYWYCDCDCGTKDAIVAGKSLKAEESKSCGCLQKERASEICKNKRKYNDYDITSFDYGVGYTSNTGIPFLFDLEDYNLIKNYTWYEDKDGYILSHTETGTIRLHRLVILKEDIKNQSIKIDHRYGVKYDNRKSELRIATIQENNRNKTYVSSATSGFIGVSYRKDRQKWRAYISVNNKQIPLGSYVMFTDAVKARLEAEIKYFEEFTYAFHVKVLNYINNGGILEPYNRKQIESIMNEKTEGVI